MKTLLNTYNRIKPDIEKRLNEFINISQNNDKQRILSELYFCILTPQSKAKYCWQAIEELNEKGVLNNGIKEIPDGILNRIRFKNNKAKYIMELKNKLSSGFGLIEMILNKGVSQKEKRDFIVENIKGIGYKEGSHFLRNIGLGFELSILDRHILKNLKKYKIIEEIPKTLTKSKYFEIENRMKKFSNKINIPMPHLDLLFWYMETGEVFK
jgi:N-glycosylase/DNA lyase